MLPLFLAATMTLICIPASEVVNLFVHSHLIIARVAIKYGLRCSYLPLQNQHADRRRTVKRTHSGLNIYDWPWTAKFCWESCTHMLACL